VQVLSIHTALVIPECQQALCSDSHRGSLRGVRTAAEGQMQRLFQWSENVQKAVTVGRRTGDSARGNW
jgi:hypothetical protein